MPATVTSSAVSTTTCPAPYSSCVPSSYTGVMQAAATADLLSVVVHSSPNNPTCPATMSAILFCICVGQLLPRVSTPLVSSGHGTDTSSVSRLNEGVALTPSDLRQSRNYGVSFVDSLRESPRTLQAKQIDQPHRRNPRAEQNTNRFFERNLPRISSEQQRRHPRVNPSIRAGHR